MKQLLILASIVLLSACGGKGVVHSLSPNSETEIIVSGQKWVVDPWETTIEVKRNGESVSAEEEVFMDAFTEKNIQIEWQSPDFAYIRFKQRNEPPLVRVVSIQGNTVEIK